LPGRRASLVSAHEAIRADDLYEEDFFAWTQAQARGLRRFARSRPNVALDLEHIAEEIADLGTEGRCAGSPEP
jgi:hypothetical protein